MAIGTLLLIGMDPAIAQYMQLLFDLERLPVTVLNMSRTEALFFLRGGTYVDLIMVDLQAGLTWQGVKKCPSEIGPQELLNLYHKKSIAYAPVLGYSIYGDE